MDRLTITIVSFSLLSLVLLPLATGPFLGSAQAAPDAPPSAGSYFINATGPSGQLIYRLSNPNGLGQPWFYINTSFNGDEYHPLQTVFIYPNGTAIPIDTVSATAEKDAFGDGYVYAGGDHGSVQAPAFRHIPVGNRYLRHPDLNATEGWLIVTWARLGSGERYDLDAHWAPGTTVELVSSGVVQSFEMADFRNGVRVGAPVAQLRAHRGDSLSFDAHGGQIYGFLGWMKTDYPAQGRFTLETHEWQREIDYNNLTGGIDDGCTCFTRGSWLFTTPSTLRATLDYVGDGRLTALYLLVAVHPSPVLPQVWAEYPVVSPPSSF